jgi:hypothetical protein
MDLSKKIIKGGKLLTFNGYDKALSDLKENLKSRIYVDDKGTLHNFALKDVNDWKADIVKTKNNLPFTEEQYIYLDKKIDNLIQNIKLIEDVVRKEQYDVKDKPKIESKVEDKPKIESKVEDKVKVGDKAEVKIDKKRIYGIGNYIQRSNVGERFRNINNGNRQRDVVYYNGEEGVDKGFYKTCKSGKFNFMEPDRKHGNTLINLNYKTIEYLYTDEISGDKTVINKEKEIDRKSNREICDLITKLTKQKFEIMKKTRKNIFNLLNRKSLRRSRRGRYSDRGEVVYERQNVGRIPLLYGNNGFKRQLYYKDGDDTYANRRGFDASLFDEVINHLVDRLNTERPEKYKEELDKERKRRLSQQISAYFNKFDGVSINTSNILDNILTKFDNDEQRKLYTMFRRSKHKSRGNSRGSYTYKNKEKYNRIDEKKLKNKSDGDKIERDFETYIGTYGNILKSYKDARYSKIFGWLATSENTKSHFIEFVLKNTKSTIRGAWLSDFDVKKFVGYYPTLVKLFNLYLINNNASSIDIVSNSDYILKHRSEIEFFTGEYDGKDNVKLINGYLKHLLNEYKADVFSKEKGSSASAVSSR